MAMDNQGFAKEKRCQEKEMAPDGLFVQKKRQKKSIKIISWEPTGPEGRGGFGWKYRVIMEAKHEPRRRQRRNRSPQKNGTGNATGGGRRAPITTKKGSLGRIGALQTSSGGHATQLGESKKKGGLQGKECGAIPKDAERKVQGGGTQKNAPGEDEEKTVKRCLPGKKRKRFSYARLVTSLKKKTLESGVEARPPIRPMYRTSEGGKFKSKKSENEWGQPNTPKNLRGGGRSATTRDEWEVAE